ncbi:hypothetical protein EV360DRAFT_90620 [Lentinula raphanica]|nr:hypothetical protein EV360DRAFT_90620 [Lentinula raphanica]
MSRFIVSFSKEETEAALAYYSSNATQFPPLVSEFFQALLRQVSQEIIDNSSNKDVKQFSSYPAPLSDDQSVSPYPLAFSA